MVHMGAHPLMKDGMAIWTVLLAPVQDTFQHRSLIPSHRAELLPMFIYQLLETELFVRLLCKLLFCPISPELLFIFIIINSLISRIRKSLRLVVCDGSGCLGLYSFDQQEGGDCSLIRQFFLVDGDRDSGHVSETDHVSDVSDTGSNITSSHSSGTYYTAYIRFLELLNIWKLSNVYWLI